MALRVIKVVGCIYRVVLFQCQQKLVFDLLDHSVLDLKRILGVTHSTHPSVSRSHQL